MQNVIRINGDLRAWMVFDLFGNMKSVPIGTPTTYEDAVLAAGIYARCHGVDLELHMEIENKGKGLVCIQQQISGV
jgi:hypothetical protein